MEAARLVKVPDSIDRGINALPKSGNNAGWVSKADESTGPAPTPAINSGMKLDNSMCGPTNAVSNGQGRQYAGKDDAKVSTPSNSQGTHAENE